MHAYSLAHVRNWGVSVSVDRPCISTHMEAESSVVSTDRAHSPSREKLCGTKICLGTQVYCPCFSLILVRNASLSKGAGSPESSPASNASRRTVRSLLSGLYNTVRLSIRSAITISSGVYSSTSSADWVETIIWLECDAVFSIAARTLIAKGCSPSSGSSIRIRSGHISWGSCNRVARQMNLSVASERRCALKGVSSKIGEETPAFRQGRNRRLLS